MAQNCVVMAFRKRLKLRGYTDISICISGSDGYLISAVEPLSGKRVSVVRDIGFMVDSFR